MILNKKEPLFPIEIEIQLFKRKPRYLHKMKLEEVFCELNEKRKQNLSSLKAFENESLKINFAYKEIPNNYSLSNIFSYFYSYSLLKSLSSSPK